MSKQTLIALNSGCFFSFILAHKLISAHARPHNL